MNNWVSLDSDLIVFLFILGRYQRVLSKCLRMSVYSLDQCINTHEWFCSLTTLTNVDLLMLMPRMYLDGFTPAFFNFLDYLNPNVGCASHLSSLILRTQFVSLQTNHNMNSELTLMLSIRMGSLTLLTIRTMTLVFKQICVILLCFQTCFLILL